MKVLHQNILNAVVEGLQQIFDEKKYADKVIEKLLRSNPKWGSRDRKFIAETIYEVVRWYRLLKYSIEPQNESHINHWEILGTWLIISQQELPNWASFKSLQKEKILENYHHSNIKRAIKESIPEWMDDLLEQELGEEQWNKEIKHLNKQASVVLRANLLKTNLTSLQAELAQQEILTSTITDFPDALLLEKRQNIFQIPQFQKGYFEVQDAGSQLIAPFLKVEEGMRVIDACAGAGGKTLHLAALMKNKGKLIAMDTEAWKLDELKKRAKRAGAFNIETRWIENNKTIKRLEESADRLLLDVPCSGLGVLKRNPDAKWKLSPDFIEEVKISQEQILDKYSRMVKIGGQLVYATCSLLPSENSHQVKKFLDKNQNSFRFIEDLSLLPSAGFDGFYMARLERIAK